MCCTTSEMFLTRVNVSASVALSKLKDSEISSLVKVGEMLQTNQANLPAFLTTDERGKHLPAFLIELSGMPEPGTQRID